MACPCFYPVERMRGGGRAAPLGDAWSGECRARGDAACLPDAATVEQLCNFGYVRERCPRFPGGDVADAVRFSVMRDQGGMVGISWVMEKGHMPFANGSLEYSRAAAGFRAGHADARIAQQALAYVSSYLRRKDGHERA